MEEIRNDKQNLINEVLSLNESIIEALVENRNCGYTTALRKIAEDGQTVIVGDDKCHYNNGVDISLSAINTATKNSTNRIKIMFDSIGIIRLCLKNKDALIAANLENERLKTIIEELESKIK